MRSTGRPTPPASTSRGRDGNDVWVVTDPGSLSEAMDVLAEAMPRRWIDEPAIEYRPVAEIDLD